jgi:hypothetical protein
MSIVAVAPIAVMATIITSAVIVISFGHPAFMPAGDHAGSWPSGDAYNEAGAIK